MTDLSAPCCGRPLPGDLSPGDEATCPDCDVLLTIDHTPLGTRAHMHADEYDDPHLARSGGMRRGDVVAEMEMRRREGLRIKRGR